MPSTLWPAPSRDVQSTACVVPSAAFALPAATNPSAVLVSTAEARYRS
jgi:hypothetical protein